MTLRIPEHHRMNEFYYFRWWWCWRVWFLLLLSTAKLMFHIRSVRVFLLSLHFDVNFLFLLLLRFFLIFLFEFVFLFDDIIEFVHLTVVIRGIGPMSVL